MRTVLGGPLGVRIDGTVVANPEHVAAWSNPDIAGDVPHDVTITLEHNLPDVYLFFDFNLLHVDIQQVANGTPIDGWLIVANPADPENKVDITAREVPPSIYGATTAVVTFRYAHSILR